MKPLLSIVVLYNATQMLLFYVFTGYIQRIHKTEPSPGASASVLLERTVIGSHSLWTVLHWGVGSKGNYISWMFRYSGYNRPNWPNGIKNNELFKVKRGPVTGSSFALIIAKFIVFVLQIVSNANVHPTVTFISCQTSILVWKWCLWSCLLLSFITSSCRSFTGTLLKSWG